MRRSSDLLLLLSVVVFTSACSLEPAGKYSRLYFSLDESSKPQSIQSDLYRRMSSLAGGDVGALAAPSSVSGFSCLGINVIGQGIPNTDGHATNTEEVLNKLISRTSYCAYPGVIAGPLTTNSPSVTLTVPAGASRLIQVVGVQDVSGTACSLFSSANGGGSNSGSGSNSDNFYEVGRALIDLYGDKSVTVGNEYDTLSAAEQSTRTLNCGGNSCSEYSYTTETTTTHSLSQNQKVAVTITPTNSMQIARASLYFALSPTGTAIMEMDVQTDASNQPSGTTVVSGALPTATSTSSVQEQKMFTFANPVSLSAGVKYWFVATVTSTDAAAIAGKSTGGSGPKCFNGSWGVCGGVNEVAFTYYTCAQ